MVSESQVDGRKSRAIRVSRREQITDPRGLTKGMVEQRKTTKKSEKDEVWMPSGGTGTVTSVVLRDDGLCIMHVMQHHYSSLYHGSEDNQPYFSTVPRLRKPKKSPTAHHEVIRARRSQRSRGRGGINRTSYASLLDTANEAKSVSRPMGNHGGSERILRVAWKRHPGVIGMALKS